MSADRKITFRLYAPKVEAVTLNGGDIPNNGKGAPMTKNAEGVWEVTLGPVPAGAYRYHFSVAGVATIDPRNPATSESNNNVWSLAVVPGSDTFDVRKRAARRGVGGNLPLGGVGTHAAHAHLYAARL